jgi:hypothetical protein
VLGLYSFVLKNSWGWHPGAETCRTLILVMNCILLSAHVDWCINCKNTYGMNNIKFMYCLSKVYQRPLGVDLEHRPSRPCWPCWPCTTVFIHDDSAFILNTCKGECVALVLIPHSNRANWKNLTNNTPRTRFEETLWFEFNVFHVRAKHTKNINHQQIHKEFVYTVNSTFSLNYKVQP